MSSITWTPAAVESELRPWGASIWRAVEAQHRVSTLRLVDTLDEQAQLERLLDASKPHVPAEAAPRHYLLATPFRYPPPHPGGSRFRAATDPGVFYGAETRRTACAELGYWRWRFLTDCPALEQLEPLPQTLFQADCAGLAVDLTQPPFVDDRQQWTDPKDYSACQQLAAVARQANADIIRYQSVRDAPTGRCAAVLAASALKAAPTLEQTWWLSVTRSRIRWQRDSALHEEHFEFPVDTG